MGYGKDLGRLSKEKVKRQIRDSGNWIMGSARGSEGILSSFSCFKRYGGVGWEEEDCIFRLANILSMWLCNKADLAHLVVILV